MNYWTHAGTGLLAGLAVDAGCALAGFPLPARVVVELPWIAAYASALADVDHHNAKIRYACPPLRALYVFAYRVVAMTKGEAFAQRTMGHRKITHSYYTAAVAGVAVEVAAAVVVWRFHVPGLMFGRFHVGRVLAELLWVSGPGVFLGWWGHIYGDGHTKHGCPKYAPVSWKRRGPRWAKTGGTSESVFNVVQTIVWLALMVGVIGGGLWRV